MMSSTPRVDAAVEVAGLERGATALEMMIFEIASVSVPSSP